MLDELDAMLAQQREQKRREPRRVVVLPDRVRIQYWSQAEQRFKSRMTTCMFRPDPM